MTSSKDQDFLDYVVDQLAGLRSISSRRMFGGIGLYQATTFFAIIDEGRLYFVTDDATRSEYTHRGMAPFQYAPGKFIATYYEVPVDVLEDSDALSDWARAAVSAQARRSVKRPRRKRAVTAVKRKSK